MKGDPDFMQKPNIEPHICENCQVKTIADLKYKDKQYCDRCYHKCIEYESDTLRKKYDIRNRDPSTLSWYQAGQRQRYEEYLELRND